MQWDNPLIAEFVVIFLILSHPRPYLPTATWCLKYTLAAKCMDLPYQHICFASQLEEIYVNFNKIPIAIYITPFMNFWKILWLTITFILSRISFFILGVLISPIIPKAMCWSYSAVRCHCMQINLTNQNGSHVNRYSASNYWNNCLVAR